MFWVDGLSWGAVCLQAGDGHHHGGGGGCCGGRRRVHGEGAEGRTFVRVLLLRGRVQGAVLIGETGETIGQGLACRAALGG